MALHTGLPGRRLAVRLRRFPVSGEHELDQQPVLLNDPELVAVLTDDMPVPGQFPGRVRLFHQMAAVAKLRILLDIGVITDSENDSEDADDEQDRDKKYLITGAEPPFQLVEQFFKEIDHSDGAS